MPITGWRCRRLSTSAPSTSWGRWPSGARRIRTLSGCHDTDEEYAVFSFSKPIREVGAPTGFNLVGFDTDSMVPDAKTGQVRFMFDQPVDDDRPFKAHDFFVVTPAGDLVPGRFFVEATGPEVLITFDRNVVVAAIGAVVSDGAVQDLHGKKNPIQLVTGETTGRLQPDERFSATRS